MMRRLKYMAWPLLAVFLLSGCFLTKVITTPMRIGGAIISTVPVVGNVVDKVIDTAADAVDKVPL